MRRLAGPAVALLLAIARPGAAVELPTDFADELVAGGLVQPVNFDFLPDGRVLLVERSTARIRLVIPGVGAQLDPVGTIPDVAATNGEQGLLGIAIDPRWPMKPYVYLHHTCAATPNIKVVRYTLTGDLAGSGAGELALDPLSRREVLADLPSDFNGHNGGTLVFGPDDLLYVALGDDDIRCTAQDRHQMRGKILRLDVRGIPDGPGPVWPYLNLAPPDNPYWNDPDPRTRLVWHRGMRNPWSFDFDPYSSVMAIADVGNARWEEIDIVNSGGRNFGWPIFEGPATYDASCDVDDVSGLAQPAYAYGHPPGAGASVILGGISYPADDIGRSFPSEYWGDVFFLDLFDGRLRRLEETAGAWAIAAPVPGQPTPEAWGAGFAFVPRMRFGADGGLWYVTTTELRRIAWHGQSVDVPETPGAGTRLALAAFPSPAPGAVTIEFTLPHPGGARLDVLDVRGHRVCTLADDPGRAAGPARVTWDGRTANGARVAPGVYFVRLDAGGERRVRPVVLVVSH